MLKKFYYTNKFFISKLNQWFADKIWSYTCVNLNPTLTKLAQLEARISLLETPKEILPNGNPQTPSYSAIRKSLKKHANPKSRGVKHAAK